MKKKNTLILYKSYLISCLACDIDQKIDNFPVSYKVFKKQLKKGKKMV